MSWDDPGGWETMQALEPRAGEQLERTMERYARVRLDPSPAQAKRARGAVMEAVWRARIEPEGVSRRWRLPFSSWSVRRVAMAGTVAVFAGLLVGTSAFAGSRAGGPLYATRIAVEDALLPADAAARAQAQIANAQVRLAEAYDAETRGDTAALSAALTAYQRDAAVLAAITGPETPMALAAIEQHRNVLLALIAKAPAEALQGLNRALDSSNNAIKVLTDTDQHQGGSGGNGTPPGGNGGNGGNGGGNGGAGGNGGGRPTVTPAPATTPNPTQKPDHTAKPKPDVTPKPTVTPKPDHTPKPRPTADPPGGPPTPAP